MHAQRQRVRRVPDPAGTRGRRTGGAGRRRHVRTHCGFLYFARRIAGIRATGGERFHVGRSRVRDNGLAHGQVQFWPDEPSVTVPPEYALLATILERLLEKAKIPFERASLDDASWVGFRLAEALPLENRERQHLLQITDPLARLGQILHYLPRFQSP